MGEGIDRSSLRAWSLHLGRDVDPVELRQELTRDTISTAIAATTAGREGFRALTIGERHMTHGELDEAAARVAGWLNRRGIQKGDVVIVLGASDLDFVVTFLGVLRIGAVVLLAAPSLTIHELEHLASDSGAVAAVGSSHVLSAFGDLRSVVPAVMEYRDVGDLDVRVDPVEMSPDEPAMLAYTSGTTGRPKGVLLSHANVLASVRAATRAWHWSDADVLVHCLPLYHQHGLSGVIATLIAGSRASIAPVLSPIDFVERVRREQASVLFSVPAVYERLVRQPHIDPDHLKSLRLATSGSAPLSLDLKTRIVERLGLDPLERYGTTESGLNLSNLYDGPRPEGSVGMPLPGLEVKLVAGDGASPPEGEPGEIVARGPQVFRGYRGLPAETAAAFTSDGWFRTGDIAVRKDGFYGITGRSKELIISGGFNVYPREVEQALESHPAVAEAGVTGLPSERWGEEVVGFVVPASPVTPAELLEHVGERLTFYKRPKRILIVDELPRNHMGKLVRAKLDLLL